MRPHLFFISSHVPPLPPSNPLRSVSPDRRVPSEGSAAGHDPDFRNLSRARRIADSGGGPQRRVLSRFQGSRENGFPAALRGQPWLGCDALVYFLGEPFPALGFKLVRENTVMIQGVALLNYNMELLKETGDEAVHPS